MNHAWRRAALFASIAMILGCRHPLENTIKSANANLSAITLSSGRLVPEFDPSILAYRVDVDNSVTSIVVAGAAADGHATLSPTGVAAQGLSEGKNHLALTVTAEDGIATKTYTVDVKRGRANSYLSPYVGFLNYVPAGKFQRDANPANLSQITTPFRIGEYELTRAQFKTVMGADPVADDPLKSVYSSGMDGPEMYFLWCHAIAFCNKLSLLEGLTPAYGVSGVDFSALAYADIPTSVSGAWDNVSVNASADGYRLPTQMEWIWAAIGADAASPGAVNTAGYLEAFAGSDGTNAIGDYAVFGYGHGEAGATPTACTNPVGTKKNNELFLFDMSGNAAEMALDSMASLPDGPLTDYVYRSGSGPHVMSGGAFGLSASSCTPFSRMGRSSNISGSETIRLVRR